MGGSTQSVMGLIASAVQIVIGLIFAQAALGKIRHWHEFKGMLDAYRLLPSRAVPGVAVGLVPFELITGLALIAAWNAPLFSIAAAGLFALFAAAMAVNIARGRTSIDCGCFQSIRQPLEWRLVVRNLVCALAVLASSAGISVDGAERWAYAWPAAVALFVIYLALNAVWALDASRLVAFKRT
jgi:hypothetical protein